MQNTKGHNEQTDPFSGYMKQRLEGHRLPVGEEVWERIEGALHRPAVSSRRIGRGGIGLAAAVFFGALIGLFFWLPAGKRERIRVAEVEKATDKEGDRSEAAHFETRWGNGRESLGDRGPAAGKKLKAGRKRLAEAVSAVSSVPSITDTMRLAVAGKGRKAGDHSKETDRLDGAVVSSVAVEGPADEVRAVGTIAEASGEMADSVSSPADRPETSSAGKQSAAFSGPENLPGVQVGGGVFVKRSERRPSGRWQLALVAGTASTSSLSPFSSVNRENSGPSQDATPDVTPGTDYSPLPPHGWPDQTFSPEDYSEADYALPLSFGWMLRKDFNARVGVETGLVYTYLSSRFTDPGLVNRKARLELHYLGIPLNLVVYAWNRPRWNVYFTAGGMVEKGLKSLYTQHVYRGGDWGVLSGGESIGGMQWSVHFSAGVDYRFYKRWSLYLEPRLSRYFDNDQPASYRTAHAWSVGLAGGVRYAF